MKKIVLGLMCLCSTSYPLYANSIAASLVTNPVNATATATANYQLTGAEQANPHAVQALKALLDSHPTLSEGLHITLGERGDKAVRKVARRIPKQAEAYYLSIQGKEIILAGHDARGTFYAVQDLRRRMNQGQLSDVTLAEAPAVRFRGVVEGFYGTPWSHEARLRQLRFYGENKMNTYIYGPKDDPYHSSPNWRLPYPEKEAKQIQELVQVARENEVDFVWAIHPGKDIRWNQEDRNNLLAKFEKMYQLGIRSFAVFFDDISGEGTNPVKQAELLNYLDEKFVQVKRDVTPLVMCPTEYNKSWSNPQGGYLNILGEKLNRSIHIMWTGDRVISDISEEGIDWINERIQRPAYIWWNFPVSDYVRDHLLLGPVYGNSPHIADRMSGFVTNPMEYADASMIAIYGVAEYAWNPETFDSEKSWKEAIRRLMPVSADALEFFAAHNSDLGVNGHGYRRDESVALQPLAARFTESYGKNGTYTAEDLQELDNLFDRMQESSDVLMASTDNLPLVAEIKPWLIQFKQMGETGEQVLAMVRAFQQGDQALFLRKYKQVKALQQAMFETDQTYNQNPYQPGVKTASKVIKPLIDQTFAAVTERYNQQHQAQRDASTDFMPHKLTSDVMQLKHIPLQVKTNRIQLSPANEVIRWQGKGFVTLELDQVYPGLRLDLNFGKPGLKEWGVLEISADGKEWKALDFEQPKTHIAVDLQGQPVKAVRFRNTKEAGQEVYLRQFTVTVDNGK